MVFNMRRHSNGVRELNLPDFINFIHEETTLLSDLLFCFRKMLSLKTMKGKKVLQLKVVTQKETSKSV